MIHMLSQENATIVVVKVIVHHEDQLAETGRRNMMQTGTERKVEAERGMIMKGREAEIGIGGDG